jgi:hypothetical protein
MVENGEITIPIQQRGVFFSGSVKVCCLFCIWKYSAKYFILIHFVILFLYVFQLFSFHFISFRVFFCVCMFVGIDPKRLVDPSIVISVSFLFLQHRTYVFYMLLLFMIAFSETFHQANFFSSISLSSVALR